MMSKILTPLQNNFLQEFFNHTQEFYLTGGTALSAFYLEHRFSEDLDFFTNNEAAFRRAENVINDVCAALKIPTSSITITSYFKHFNVGEKDDFLTIHFSKDVSYHVKPPNHFGNVIVDSLEDIMANKICAVLGRTEMKDLVDLFFLDQAGHKIDQYFSFAEQKDGGLTHDSLAYALSQFDVIEIPKFVIKPLTIQELKNYLESLIEHHIHLSRPPTGEI